MKIASLLAGAALAALTATAATAGNPVYQGSVTTHGVIPFLNIPYSTTNTSTLAVAAADALNPGINSNTALFVIEGLPGFSNNSGTANAAVNGASFSLSGSVSADCAYYVGNASTTIAFGQIGINAQDNNPTQAFEMVDASRSVSIETNLAGCNTKNNVTVSKVNLTNTDTAGFDALQFTDTLPFSIDVGYTAGAVGDELNAGPQNWTLAAGQSTDTKQHGAWKSPFEMTLNIPNPGKALLAGTYNGSVSVSITAF